ncbi:MAG: M50 family metallopeptidase [Clostridia bacterium]|nr:M50 family metallopeptidase [Clostridia bacterium]
MKQIGRYIVILIVIMALWNTVIVKPLKVFTVYLHELGHTVMAFVFGYGIKEFKVNYNEGGYTVVQAKGWFSEFMIANGGYLGSVFLALLILYLRKTSFKKYIMGSLAIVFLIISLKYSSFRSFTPYYSIMFAAVVLALYMIQNEKLNDWVIDIVGISSLAYAFYDTFVDTILLQINLKLHLIEDWRGGPVTDAMKLAEMTYIPAVVWGTLWILVAVLASKAVLLKAPSKGKK